MENVPLYALLAHASLIPTTIAVDSGRPAWKQDLANTM